MWKMTKPKKNSGFLGAASFRYAQMSAAAAPDEPRKTLKLIGGEEQSCGRAFDRGGAAAYNLIQI